MAHFTYNSGDIHLSANKDEEITPEMVAAWAAIERISALRDIAIAISELGRSIEDAMSAFGAAQNPD